MPFVDKQGTFSLDGFDFGSTYQMVPLNGERDLVVDTTDEAVLTVSDSTKAILSNFRNLTIGATLPVNTAHSLKLPGKSRFRFTIKGLSPGFTGLEITESGGGIDITNAMTISVKATRQVRFSFAFLADLKRKNVRGQIEPRFLMDQVTRIYKEQANVELLEFGHMMDITVLGDLGNPILTSRDSVLDAIEAFTGPENFSCLGPGGFIVYLCWDVERTRGVSDTRGLTVHRGGSDRVYAFIEPGRNFADSVHVLAHEIGHALGLSHNHENSLMFAFDSAKSNRLFGGDIEVVNPVN